jgi:hypothetical protein
MRTSTAPTWRASGWTDDATVVGELRNLASRGLVKDAADLVLVCVLLCDAWARLGVDVGDPVNRVCDVIGRLAAREDNPCWLDQTTFEDLVHLAGNPRNLRSITKLLKSS